MTVVERINALLFDLTGQSSALMVCWEIEPKLLLINQTPFAIYL